MDNSGDEFPILHLLPILQRIVGLTDIHKKFGLTKSQIIIFLILHYKSSMTMSEAAQYICSSKEQATRTVAALCDNGLVERYEDSGNRTMVHIRLTRTGEEHLRMLVSTLRSEIAERLRSSLDEDDIQRLHDAANTAVEILCKVK